MHDLRRVPELSTARPPAGSHADSSQARDCSQLPNRLRAVRAYTTSLRNMSRSGLGQQPCLFHSCAPHRSRSRGQTRDAPTAAAAGSSAALPVRHRPGKLPTSPMQTGVSVSDLEDRCGEVEGLQRADRCLLSATKWHRATLLQMRLLAACQFITPSQQHTSEMASPDVSISPFSHSGCAVRCPTDGPIQALA